MSTVSLEAVIKTEQLGGPIYKENGDMIQHSKALIGIKYYIAQIIIIMRKQREILNHYFVENSYCETFWNGNNTSDALMY